MSDATASTLVADKELDEMSPSKFTKLAGLKIIARTDTEDELLKNNERSDLSSSIADTLNSKTSTDFPSMDESFFYPPQDLKDGIVINEKSQSGRSLPTIKTQPVISTKSHHRSRSDGGACFMIPVGDTNEVVRGRFTLRREEVDSSYWKPRRITGPSRFYD